MKQMIILIIIGLIFGLLLVLLDGSDHNFDPKNIPEEKISPKSHIGYCIIDSCEYITWGHRFAHKGNCKFCAERHRNEIYDLVKQFKDGF